MSKVAKKAAPKRKAAKRVSPWKPGRVKQIRKIKLGDPDARKKLLILSTNWGLTRNQVYQKWMYENKEKIQKKKAEAQETIIDPDFRFELIPGRIEFNRVDNAELVQLKKGLDLIIPKLGIKEGAFTIKNKYVNKAKSYMKEKYPEMVMRCTALTEVKDKKPVQTGFTRISRIK
jgi:hypothetical protein